MPTSPTDLEQTSLAHMEEGTLRALYSSCQNSAQVCASTYMATGDVDALAGQKRFSALARLYDAELSRREQDRKTARNNFDIARI